MSANRDASPRYPSLKDKTAVRWVAKDGSLFTEEEFKVPGTLPPGGGRHAVAFNLGPQVAEHIAQLHNAHLARESEDRRSPTRPDSPG